MLFAFVRAANGFALPSDAGLHLDGLRSRRRYTAMLDIFTSACGAFVALLPLQQQQ